MANDVVVSFSEQLTDKLVSVEAALPKTFNRTRFVQNALAVCNANPSLMKINRNEVIQGLMRAAYLDLDFLNRECYLIPYGNTVQFQTDYKGEIKFVKKYSIRPIKDIYAKVVREGDSFEETVVDGHPSVNFKPVPFNDKEIIGTFAVCLFEDGGMLYESMSIAEVMSVRNNYSKQSQGKAWKNSAPEMIKKVCLRRLCKHIETDFENIEARAAWEDGSGMEFDNTVRSSASEEGVVDAFCDTGIVVEEINAEVVSEADEVFG